MLILIAIGLAILTGALLSLFLGRWGVVFGVLMICVNLLLGNKVYQSDQDGTLAIGVLVIINIATVGIFGLVEWASRGKK